MRSDITPTPNLSRRTAGGYFHWEELGEPVVVNLHLNAIELLDRDASRGVSTCGILLGKRTEGLQPTLVVENHEPVPNAIWKTSDSAFGDRRQLKAMIDRWQARPQRRMDVLGFYRTSTANETMLSEDDLAVITEIASETELLFLLIEPRSGKPNSGHLFLTHNNVVTWEWKKRPFNRAELSGRGAPVRTEIRRLAAKRDTAPRIAEGPEMAAPPVSYPMREEEKRAPFKPEKWHLIAGAALIAILLGLGVFHVVRSNESGAHVTPGQNEARVDADLDLKFERIGSDLRLSWNPQADGLVDATSAQLIIQDGPVSKTINLDGNDLRRGSIIYSPLTDDLTLQLKVNAANGGLVAQSLRIVGGLPTLPTSGDALEDSSTVIGKVPATTAVRSGVPEAERDFSEGVRQASASVPPRSQTEIVAPDRAKFAAGRKAFDTPIQTSTQVRESRLQPLAARSKSAASSVDTAAIAKSRGSAIVSKPAEPVSPSAPIRTPVESIPVIGAAPSSSTAAFATSTPVYRRSGGTLQPAQLLTNINPVYPVDARESGIAGTVELRFKIGTTGDVHDIVVVRGPLVLAEAAVDAVRERRYKPARVDGVPTETDASGIFDFKLR